ncbi:hypothetical protein P3T76_008164 [Phytophthora citrophthora]|uniref:Uncharacterized protein n=1 Tax=Phytophthora citrophthora TaxID=4793 RepID=A0AAD9GM63_9STRA|nr:hypothetical protein P3T76_008164 [Phytophthora citrophthora]
MTDITENATSTTDYPASSGKTTGPNKPKTTSPIGTTKYTGSKTSGPYTTSVDETMENSELTAHYSSGVKVTGAYITGAEAAEGATMKDYSTGSTDFTTGSGKSTGSTTGTTEDKTTTELHFRCYGIRH